MSVKTLPKFPVLGVTSRKVTTVDPIDIRISPEAAIVLVWMLGQHNLYGELEVVWSELDTALAKLIGREQLYNLWRKEPQAFTELESNEVINEKPAIEHARKLLAAAGITL